MRAFLFSCCLFLAARASAGEGQIALSHKTDIWDRTAGFPGGYVYSITQTADGYLWIGTGKGLVRFDGESFELNTASGSNPETGFAVVGLVTDVNDQMWVTNDQARLFRYSGRRLLNSMAIGSEVFWTGPIATSRDGWVLSVSDTQGLVEYEHGRPRVLLKASSSPSSPTAVVQAADGTFWIGTRDEGLYHLWLTAGGRKLERVNGLPDPKINCLLPIGASAVLVGTDRGLRSVQQSGKAADVPLEMRNLQIRALARDGRGGIWIGANSRLFQCKLKDGGTSDEIDALTHSDLPFPVSALFVDRVGNLWIGGPEVVARYQANGFSTYLNSTASPCKDCGPIYVDDQMNVWLGPRSGGLLRIANGSMQLIRVAGLADDSVYSICGTAHELWLGRKYGGVTRLRMTGNSIEADSYTEEDGLAENSVTAIYCGPDGTVWAGTAEKGVSRFRNGAWQNFSTRDGLPSNRISAIAGDSRGRIFLGTPDGVAEFRNNQWIIYSTHNGLPPGEIETLLLDDSGVLWIGTANGLALLQEGRIHLPLRAPDTLFGEVRAIAESNGWLWLTTADHVLRIEKRALLANSAVAAGDYREFGTADGLPGTQGVRRFPSLTKDTRGRLWFSLSRGIAVLEPSSFAHPDSPVSVRLDEMIVDTKAISSTGAIRVPPGRRRLTFRYAGVNIFSPETMKYRYRLLNVDPTWSKLTRAREVDYTNVPPGNYRFEVMALDADGFWTGSQSIAFEVNPSFWQTLWFPVACIAAAVSLGGLLYRLRLRQITAQMNLLHAERVAERTRIARELHDTLLQSFQGLLLRFQSVSNLLPKRPEEGKRRLESAIDDAAQAISESRAAVRELRSSSFLPNDLGASLHALVKEFSSDQIVEDRPELRVQVRGAQRDLNPLLRDELYRIAAEALRNAYRHANARNVEVDIQYHDGWFQLRIRDDGRGIDETVLRGTTALGHWGLRGMRERAELLNAKLEVWSKPNHGTDIELTVPATIAYASHPPQRSKEGE